jgi:protocatechuate 3,4-dioxygenase beta subunit
MPDGYAVASVSFNGRSAANTTVDLEESESTIGFVLTSRPCGIAGTVRDANRNPVPEAAVVLLPESLPDSLERFDETSVRVTTSDAGGAYRFTNLAPGRYKLAALAGDERQKARDLSFLRDRVRSADAVTLDFGQNKTLDLNP